MKHFLLALPLLIVLVYAAKFLYYWFDAAQDRT